MEIKLQNLDHAYMGCISLNEDLLVIKSSSGRMVVYSLEKLELVKKFRFSTVDGSQDDNFIFSLDDKYLLNKEHYTKLKPLGKINKDIMKSFREYLLVGGMPQAVVEYVISKDFGKVDFAKQNILNLYENDIETQDEENPTYVKNIFLHIPSELSKHDKQLVLSHIDGARRR